MQKQAIETTPLELLELLNNLMAENTDVKKKRLVSIINRTNQSDKWKFEK